MTFVHSYLTAETYFICIRAETRLSELVDRPRINHNYFDNRLIISVKQNICRILLLSCEDFCICNSQYFSLFLRSIKMWTLLFGSHSSQIEWKVFYAQIIYYSHLSTNVVKSELLLCHSIKTHRLISQVCFGLVTVQGHWKWHLVGTKLWTSFGKTLAHMIPCKLSAIYPV